jgi:hypothetical protein
MPTALRQRGTNGLLCRNAAGQIVRAVAGTTCGCGTTTAVCNLPNLDNSGDTTPCTDLPQSISVETAGLELFDEEAIFTALGDQARVDFSGSNFNQSVCLTSTQDCPTVYVAHLTTAVFTDYVAGPFDPVTGDAIPYTIDFYVTAVFGDTSDALPLIVKVAASVTTFEGLFVFSGAIPRTSVCGRYPYSVDNQEPTDNPSSDPDIHAGFNGSVEITGAC